MLFPMLLLLLTALTLCQNSFLTNCEIANLATSTCLTCKSGFSLIANQCLQGVFPDTAISGSNQLTLSNLFSSGNTQNQQGTSLIYSNNNFNSNGGSDSSINNQAFIPGYLVPAPTPSPGPIPAPTPNQNQPQSAYILSLLSYLASQQAAQGQAVQANTISSNPTNMANAQNTDPNCKVRSSISDMCQQCYQSFYYNVTLGNCLTVNPLCRNYTQQNQCTSCYEGYNLTNGNCIVSSTFKTPDAGDVNCKVRASGSAGCLECYPSFYFNSSQGKCVEANPLCRTVTNMNKCTSCYPGYSLDVGQGSCVIGNSTADVQVNTGGGSGAGGVTDQNAAILAQLSQYFGSAPPGSNGNFVRQIGNYQVVFNSQGQVISVYQPNNSPQASLLNPSTLDPHCAQYSNGLCQSCQTGFYLASQTCVSIDPYCLLWNAPLCLQCVSGYQLTAGRCTSVPAAAVIPPTSPAPGESPCFFRQVWMNGGCVQVSDNCKSWDQKAQCKSCYGGYRLSGGQCSPSGQ